MGVCTNKKEVLAIDLLKKIKIALIYQRRPITTYTFMK